MEQFSIDYRLDEEEIRMSLSQVWLRQKGWKTGIFALVFLLAGVDFFWVANYFVGVISLAAAVAVVLVPFFGIRKSAAFSSAQKLYYRLVFEEPKITVDVSSPFGEEHHPYDIGYENVHKIYETQEFFMISVTKEKIIPIPKGDLEPELQQAVSGFFAKVFGEKYRAVKAGK